MKSVFILFDFLVDKLSYKDNKKAVEIIKNIIIEHEQEQLKLLEILQKQHEIYTGE